MLNTRIDIYANNLYCIIGLLIFCYVLKLFHYFIFVIILNFHHVTIIILIYLYLKR